MNQSIRSDLEVISLEHESCSLSHLSYGAESLVLIFVPYCYGELNNGNSMESFIMEMNRKIDLFNQNDFRVILISRLSSLSISE